MSHSTMIKEMSFPISVSYISDIGKDELQKVLKEADKRGRGDILVETRCGREAEVSKG